VGGVFQVGGVGGLTRPGDVVGEGRGDGRGWRGERVEGALARGAAVSLVLLAFRNGGPGLLVIELAPEGPPVGWRIGWIGAETTGG
jgi:hypothetical protein